MAVLGHGASWSLVIRKNARGIRLGTGQALQSKRGGGFGESDGPQACLYESAWFCFLGFEHMFVYIHSILGYGLYMRLYSVAFPIIYNVRWCNMSYHMYSMYVVLHDTMYSSTECYMYLYLEAHEASSHDILTLFTSTILHALLYNNT